MQIELGTILKYKDHGQLYPAQQGVRWRVFAFGLNDAGTDIGWVLVDAVVEPSPYTNSPGPREHLTMEELEREFEVANDSLR